MTLCPVYPKTQVLPGKRETWEIQVTQDPLELQVFLVSLDLMALRETEDSLDFRDYLGDKDPQALLERLEMKAVKASVTLEIQAHQGSQALLDSGASQETLIWALQDQLVSLAPVAHRDQKVSLALQGMMEYQAPLVCLGALDPKDKEDRMGPQVCLVPQDPLLTSVLKEDQVSGVLWVPRVQLDPQGFLVRKVRQGQTAFQGLDQKAL